MKIDVAEESGITIVRPIGKLDALTAPDLQDAMDEVLAGHVERLVVDLSEVPFVSSAGLRVFVVIAKHLKGTGKFVVSGLSENVRQVFQLVGLDGLVPLHAHVASALQEFNAANPTNESPDVTTNEQQPTER